MAKRIIPSLQGIPYLEPLRHEVYDTKILPPDGITQMEFFSKPDLNNRLMTNMYRAKTFPSPQQFHVFGLAIEAYSVHPHIDQKIVKATSTFDELRKLLFANAVIRFLVGRKWYLEIPVNRIVGEPLPSGCVDKPSSIAITTQFIAPFDITMKETIGNPEKHRKLLDDYALQIFIGNPEKENFYYDVTIERPKSKQHIRLIVTDQPRRVNYFDLCVLQSGKNKALHIPDQQTFEAKLEWQKPISYDPELLGKVHVRVGLPGILWREIQ